MHSTHPGAFPPTNGEGQLVFNPEPAPKGHHKTQADSRSTVANDQALAAIRAALGRRGYRLHRDPNGMLTISRWNHSRTVAGIEEAELFLRQIGGRS